MDKVIVAFAAKKSSKKIQDMLEISEIKTDASLSSGAAVLRAASCLESSVVVCGCKLADMTALELEINLPRSCKMLVVGTGAQLYTYGGTSMRLTAPMTRSELFDAVSLLLNEVREVSSNSRNLSEHEAKTIGLAKKRLMDEALMTEKEAHCFLQKMSMDSCEKMIVTAHKVLTE